MTVTVTVVLAVNLPSVAVTVRVYSAWVSRSRAAATYTCRRVNT